MAVDEAIFITTKEKNLSPTLRFYRWRPSVVSIGYAQNVGEEVNLKECKRLKMDVVRRYTGGGAIFHDDELTYSFISKTDGYQHFDDLLASYKQVCWGIIKGLSELGISVKFREELYPHLNPSPTSGEGKKEGEGERNSLLLITDSKQKIINNNFSLNLLDAIANFQNG